jgi:hypothetical protein
MFTPNRIGGGKPLNVKLSSMMAIQIQADPHSCWQNALNALAEMSDESAMYVEGWAVNKRGLVFEHSWVQTDNEIIDPTLYNVSPLNYIAGVALPLDQLYTLVGSKCQLPLSHSLDNEDGNLYQSYKLAYYEAASAARNFSTPDVLSDLDFSPKPKAQVQARTTDAGDKYLQGLADRAARRIASKYPYLDNTRLRAERSAGKLALRARVAVKNDDFELTCEVPASVLNSSEDEIVSMMEKVAERCVRRFLGNE